MPNHRRQAVFLFSEGGSKNLSPQVRGGKGAGLADLARLGAPLPPGFTVTTTVARAISETGRLPRRLARQIHRGIAALERETGKGFGDPANPLLVSVRSGAAVSMPGMMDTVLNLGLNPETVKGLAERAGERFALDCYRRFLAVFGEVALGVERDLFEGLLQDAKREQGVAEDRELGADALYELCGLYRELIEEQTGSSVPDDPWLQLSGAIFAVLSSWDGERAALYRQAHDIPHWWGTAVNIQAMVFGNHGDDSGTGVVFSRNVATGEAGLYGEFLPNAQGEDVVAGVRTPVPIDKLRSWSPVLYDQLHQLVRQLEIHYRDVVDVEFTVEAGRLYLLQARKAKRTPEAAMKIAVHGVWECLWTKGEALARVTPEQVEQSSRPGFEPQALEQAKERLFAKGLPASPGAAVGMAVFSSKRAEDLARSGESVVLIRPDTSPDDLPGMLAACAVVTATGGLTSHAAVVARGLGKPAIVGCADLRVDFNHARCGEQIVQEGDTVSVDGQTGTVFVGQIPLAAAACQPKEVNIFLRWQEMLRLSAPKPRIGFERAKERVSANTLLNDFYLTDAMAQASVGTALVFEAAQLRNQTHAGHAEFLACYLAIAVAGELRHAQYGSRESRSALDGLSTRFGLRFGGNRAVAQNGVIEKLKKSSLEEQAEFFRLAAVAFDQCHWSNSYGGGPWAQIARAPMEFLNGRLGHSLFVDYAFDLQHNGGRLFDKHPAVSSLTDEDILRRQLDAKKISSAVGEMKAELAGLWDKFSPQVLGVFEKGRKLGIWAA